MLNKIIEFSINNKLVVALSVLALIVFGTVEFTRLPIDAVPDITDNQVQVITTAPSLGAPDVERLITFPIEQACSNVAGLKQIRSFSRFGLSIVTIVFDDDMDIFLARQQVTEKLKIAEADIPPGVGTPELGPVTTGLGEIYQYVLRPARGYEHKYDQMELRTIQDWIVRRQLLGIPGIAEISSFGGKVKQYQVAIVPSRLQANQVNITDIFTALEKNNQNTGGAYIEKSSTVLYIRSEGLIQNAGDISRIVVKTLADGRPVLISDIADVTIGAATRYGSITYNDQGEVAGGVVMMLKGENSGKVIAAVRERVAKIQETLPKGVILEEFLDRTKMVDGAINTVTHNLLEGALIVIFILVIFLGNLRAGLLVASVIPLSMLFAVILMNIFGVSGNLMSLGALDFGLIVDGAVIIVEAVMHGLHDRFRSDPVALSRREMDAAVRGSASRMMNSAVFGQIIILVVYLPIFSLQGIEGKMFKPMAETVAFALLGAFILSLTYVPVMSAWAIRRKPGGNLKFSDKLVEWFSRLHQRLLVKVLRHPGKIIAASVLMLAVSLFLFSTLGGEFIPELPEGDFAVETRVLPGSKLGVSSQVIAQSAKVLRARFPEVIKVVGRTGSGEVPTDPMSMETSDLYIILKEKSEWTSAGSWNELKSKMRTALNDVPGATFGFSYPVAMRFNELMTGSKQDVVCKIFGDNIDTLAQLAAELGKIASTVKGARDIYVEPVEGLPQLIIRYNRSAISQFGLNIEDVNSVVNMAFAGQKAGQVYQDDKRFDLVVKLQEDARQNLDDVKGLLVPTPNGNQVPLEQIADVRIEESINQIQRETARRRIIVGFNVGGRDVQSVVDDLQAAVTKKLHPPTGYSISYGGSFQNLQAAKARLFVAVPVSLALIFILLFFAFGSVKQGLLIYSAIPLSAIGGILFLVLRGIPFSISAGVGFIALFGVAVLNGIVLLAEFNALRKSGISDPVEIVKLGTKNRLRPVLMTAFVASLGFLPMALSTGSGSEVQRPLATVVIGGLLVATFLTLFVLPCLYVLTNRKMKPNPGITTILGILFLLPFFAQSQTAISLPAAIDSAIANSYDVKNQRLVAEYQQKLIGSAMDLPQTNFSGLYGQFNSAYVDNQLAVAQSFDFPTIYARQKALLKHLANSSSTQIEVRETELRRDVSASYFRMVCLQQKVLLYRQMDSIYDVFVERTMNRFDKGEADVLEKISAEAQHGKIELAYKAAENDLALEQLNFQLLLNSETLFVPEANQPAPTIVSANMGEVNAIFLSQAEADVRTADLQVKLEKSRLLPNLQLGVGSATIQGLGADNKTYSIAKRFTTLNFGVNLPLFFGAYRSRIKAASVQTEIAENELEYQKKQLANGYHVAFRRYENVLETYTYMQNTSLRHSEIILSTANKRFSEGSIDYLDWAQLMSDAYDIRTSLADTELALRLAILDLQFLSKTPH